MSRKVKGYIWASTAKQDLDKSRYLLLEHTRGQQLRIADYRVGLANVYEAENPSLERPISYNFFGYSVQYDPALTSAWQPISGLNLFEGMCKKPHVLVSPG